jgi:hypothetical protein
LGGYLERPSPWLFLEQVLIKVGKQRDSTLPFACPLISGKDYVGKKVVRNQGRGGHELPAEKR